MSKEYFAPLSMESFPHDVWMCLQEAYGDPQVPLFLDDILPPINPIMVSTTPDEIIPPDAHVSSTNLVPAIDALDLGN